MRQINKIIVHCSATPKGKEVTVEEIDKWHKERGFKSIGYHYVIYLDGSVHEGRPLHEIGAHCKGYNSKSIGICYIGGLDLNGKPKDTRTVAQKAALYNLLKELKAKCHTATIHGHNEFSAKACPCFDVQNEYKGL